ncbi:NAD(P)/FAD-dependent oxidoreductase [Dysgonomonas sp. 520]|uniref:protoporphyrinogen/coproporphyrinogen oxidase n=1 Tax=Dysgonomonas sp. 520 TaxID=2302931 RepID=UPI0013D580A1|nr:FAD-dependent oxidoreductase [Dysgonomonas sp. 520]NDW09093.1 UDP-galactopyranose mutase [Dysgonomonas sp. 520]
MKIAIIGTGISGLSMANLLKDNHKVVLFEKQDRYGGLVKCDIVDSVLFHKVGGHVFNSRNQDVLEWFWSHFNRDEEFIKVKRNSKIFFQNKIIGYPIENYIYNFDKETVTSIVKELTEHEENDKISPFEYPNFEEFLKSNFGETLYNLYFKPYNNKIWRTDLSTVPMQWLEGKLPMPNFQEIMVSNIVREEEDTMVHSSFFYPKKGGSQFIVDRLAQGLDIRTSKEIDRIVKENGKYTVDGESGFDKIVFCGDVRKMPDYMENIVSQKIDISRLKTLRSNGTSNLLCETDENDYSWLYIPEESTRAHRIIYTGNFAPSNNENRKRKTCVVEFSGKTDYEDMVQEIKKLPGNLSPIHYNYEPNSYVIQSFDTKELILETKDILEEENIYLLGRFAEWEYYNMDKCIESAMYLSEKM